MTKDYEAIPCEVCRDLAPLVADGVASEQSAALVRAHLAACPACAAAGRPCPLTTPWT